jgi:hypothetical protein
MINKIPFHVSLLVSWSYVAAGCCRQQITEYFAWCLLPSCTSNLAPRKTQYKYTLWGISTLGVFKFP